MKKYIYILILFFCLAGGNVFSQRIGLMLGGGITYYYGEMNDRVLTHEKLLRPYISGGLLFRLSPHFDLWASYMHGQLAGDDSLAVRYSLRNRNLDFRTDIDEVSLNIGYRILGPNRKGNPRRIVPYIFAGVGGFHFKPEGEINGSYADLQSIGTEGQYIDEDNYPEPYDLYQVSFPAGIGIEFCLSRSWFLRLEAANHFLLTDYLDDVSGRYPDSASLASTPNGALAVLLSNKQKDGDFPDKGMKRGNSSVKDSFTHIGISILWTPGGKGKSNSGLKKKKNKHNCPAYH
jgi:hypothetical protein